MQRRDRVRLTIGLFVIAAVIACPFILHWYWHFYWEGGTRVQSILPAPPACYVPPDVAVDGFANANVQAWDDLNGDGRKGNEEPPLQNVLVIMVPTGYVYNPEPPPISAVQETDKNGMTTVSDFRPGCACNCWTDRAVAAWGPQGYEATTPTLVALTMSDGTVNFGFRKVAP